MTASDHMCGRFATTTSPTDLAAIFGTTNLLVNFGPRYNAAPTQELPVVRYNPATRERSLDMLRWGLVPLWAKDLSIGTRAINARAEQIEQKPMFREAFHKRRCLIPAEAFYEWQGEKGNKQPFAFEMKDRSSFAFAGLWERWKQPETGELVRSFTIITTGANETVSPVHNRMPVILPPELWSRWMGEKETEASSLQEWLRPFPANNMTCRKISPAVNSVRNDSAELLNSA